ncbi:hypothetical protein FKR81_02535 [Lentzea tibetensis]|uniref:Uncharacterized protein n=1 Tax=Lentzea tibetensis TaxID=2591470 RepID=A0A563F1P6_9PSEU|nr:hypothetical protein [Lentzea tibetensis]TWP53658.1 hypothetical protein FKR81_02535 [Lentzea tibetensis]
MTENQVGGVREAAQQEGAAVAHHAKEAAGEVSAAAQEQVGQVAREARAQANHVVRDVRDKVADTSRQAARYLDERGARGLLDSAQDFARRRPDAFLLGAAAAGFVVGRVAKSATDQQGKGQHVARRPEPVRPPEAQTRAPSTRVCGRGSRATPMGTTSGWRTR